MPHKIQRDRPCRSEQRQRCGYCRTASAFSVWETADRAFSSSLCAVAISNCRPSNPAFWRSRDAGILRPRAERKSSGTPREAPASRGAAQYDRSRLKSRGSGFPISRFRDGESADTGSSSESKRRSLTAAQLHQHSVHRNPVEPGGECRIAAERADAAKYLQESFLGEIFGVGYILRHEQTDRIHTLLVESERAWQKPARRRCCARCTRLRSDSSRLRCLR